MPQLNQVNGEKMEASEAEGLSIYQTRIGYPRKRSRHTRINPEGPNAADKSSEWEIGGRVSGG